MSTTKNKTQQVSSQSELMIVTNTDNVLVDAKLLHQRLKITTRFNDWIKRRIEEFGFKENEDFYSNLSKISLSRSYGRPTMEFRLTIDMAKELAMLERNEIGRNIRRYFIEAEKNVRKQTPAFMQLPKGMKTVNVNNRKLYMFVDVLKKLGYTNCGSQYAKAVRYPNHFMHFNSRVYVTSEFVQLMLLNRMVRNQRNEVKQMQGILPLDFGTQPLQLKGGTL